MRVCSTKSWEELAHLLLKQAFIFQAVLFAHIPAVHIWLKTILGIEYRGWGKVIYYQGFNWSLIHLNTQNGVFPVDDWLVEQQEALFFGFFISRAL